MYVSSTIRAITQHKTQFKVQIDMTMNRKSGIDIDIE